jgi:hypothetical protein
MKIRLNVTTVSSLFLLCLAASAPPASAFYDPSIQRWINRDPRGEIGFEALRKGFPVDRTALQNSTDLRQDGDPYRFSGNSPGTHVDPEGLQTCPIGPCLPIPNQPQGTWAFCIFRCYNAGKVWTGIATVLLCFPPGGNATIWIGCLCI